MNHQLHLTNTFKELDPMEWISGGKALRTFAWEDKDDFLSSWAYLQRDSKDCKNSYGSGWHKIGSPRPCRMWATPFPTKEVRH